jgi:CubicO group peptidase (beta-lactamase class C family)
MRAGALALTPALLLVLSTAVSGQANPAAPPPTAPLPPTPTAPLAPTPTAPLAPTPTAPLAPTPTAPLAPTIDQRLARLCEDVEQRRNDLKISGLSLAIVKDDRVILARGFGVRDREKNLPCDEKTLFGIGSTTKAFTSMLVAMLAEEGRLSFSERPAKYLPWFKFKDPETDAKATLRDLMAHRTGLTRTDMAWMMTPATREELLRNIAETEKNAEFRKAWQYNNAMFLCAGECAAAVAGRSWDELVQTRIFAPLGMTRSGTTSAFALADPLLSKGYDWDDKKNDFAATRFMAVDNCGPAGSITSTVVDMAQWVRFLLNRGTYEGRRLVRAEAFDELWRDDDDLVPNYGQGWFIHPGDAELEAVRAAKAKDPAACGPVKDTQSWKDGEGRHHLVIEHGGNVPGFAAEVGLLPEYHLGVVMLSNVSASQLQAGILDLVFDGLLGPWRERRQLAEGAPLPESATKSWLGAYSEGRIGLPPRILQRSSDHLVLVFPPAPGQVAMAAYTLRWAGDDGRFWLREDPDAYVTVDRDAKGTVESLTLVRNGDARCMKPLPQPPPPEAVATTVDELMAARAAALGSDKADGVKTLRLTGTMSLPQSGIRGSYRLLARGSDALRIEFDAGRFGRSLVVVDGSRGFRDNHFTGLETLDPAQIATIRFANPLVESGNWLDHASECDVVGAASVSALGLPMADPISAVNRATTGLPSLAGLPSAPSYAPFLRVSVKPGDADPINYYVDGTSRFTTLIEGPVAFPGVPNALPFAWLSDVRDVGNGLKIAFRREAFEPQVGKLILDVKKVELDVELPADTFAMRTPPAPAAGAKPGS